MLVCKGRVFLKRPHHGVRHCIAQGAFAVIVGLQVGFRDTCIMTVL